MPNEDARIQRLHDMLTYCRGHGSAGEAQFIEQYITPYAPTALRDPRAEQVYAYVVQVGSVQSNPVLWSCHVDTVHAKTEPVRQVVQYDPGCGLMYKEDNKPLGADDGAGVWLLLEMIDAGVPGTYIFHRGEECGGIGSRGIATHYPEFIKPYKWAIAFDRKGTGDIITDQYTGNTASLKFATALAAKLGGAYAPSDTGIFTDTANYANTIPECTNVSVGYDAEHTPNETLDIWHLTGLRDVIVLQFMQGVDLPAKRDPDAAWGGIEGGWEWKPLKTKKHNALPGDAMDILQMQFGKLVTKVKKAKAEDIADLLCELADEIAYHRDRALQLPDAEENQPMYDWRNI